MFQLREDLILVPAQGKERSQVREPKSGAVFEFGEQEFFLVDTLRHPCDVKNLLDVFNSRFKLSNSPEDLQEFLDLLINWGLVETVISKHIDAQDELNPPNRWHLFNPEVFIDTFNRILSPLKIFLWLIPIIIIYSAFAIWFNRYLISDALANAKLHFGFISRIVFIGLIINLVVQLSRGLVARHFGLRIPSFGILLAFGVIPRFNIKISITPEISKRNQAWLSATSLLARLLLFGLSITLWLVTKSSGSLLSTFGAELALISAISFLFTVNPLLMGDGYQLLCLSMDTPNLRQRANHALQGIFRQRPKVIAKHTKNPIALAVFAIASLVSTAALVVFLTNGLMRWLKSNYQGAGIALFLVIMLYVFLNYLRRIKFRKRVMEYRIATDKDQYQVMPQRAPTLDKDLQKQIQQKAAAKLQQQGSTKRKWFSYGILLILTGSLFLPYPYETGGIAEIFPVTRYDIYPETEGMIEKVYYQGGEWVEQGTILGYMVQYRQQKDIMVTKASIEAKNREIDRLRSTPSVESVRQAEAQLKTAQLELRYSIEQADRLEKLFAKGTVSAQELDDARKVRDVDRQQVEEKRTSLEAIKAEINPYQIAAAEADLKKLQHELVFYEESLQRTFLRTPITGRIVTTKLKELEKRYLKEGDLFAEVENAHEVRVEIAIPEFDIFDVKIGALIRFKTWANPGRIFTGTVTEIAPTTSQETYGKVLKVTAIIPNTDSFLKTGMTGYGKTKADDTIVLIAFTKAIVRFFSIEIWSWLP